MLSSPSVSHPDSIDLSKLLKQKYAVAEVIAMQTVEYYLKFAALNT